MPHSIIMGFVIALAITLSGFSKPLSPSFLQAEHYFNDSLFKPALKEYQDVINGRQILKKTGSSGQDSLEESTAYYKIAICNLKLNDSAKASDAFDDFVRIFPHDGRVVDARFLAAEAQKSIGNLKEASERFFQVWRRFPASGLAPDALMDAARCAQACGDRARAAELFGQYCESWPKTENAKDATVALVKLLLSQNDIAGAEKRCEDARKLWPTDKSFLSRISYCRALCAVVAGKMESARGFYAAILSSGASFPEQEEALLGYISFANARKDCKTGCMLFERLAGIYQRKGQALSREYLLSWAQSAQECQAYQDEEKLLRRMLASFGPDSLSPRVLLMLSRCQLKRGDTADAFEALKSLSSNDTLSEYGAQAILSLADLYNGQAQYDDAITAYRRYCRMKGARERDRALFAVGTIYKENFRRYDAAAQEFEALIRGFGESALYHEALFSLAECEEKAGGIKMAVLRYARVVDSDAPKDLVDKARKRMSYLSAFRAENLENTVRLLAGIAQKKADSSDMAPRLMRVAEIYGNDLRDYEAALALYEQIPGYLRNPSDSITGRLFLCKARVFEKLSEKMRFENDSAKADSVRGLAIALYNDVLKLPRLSAVSDDAAFRLMMLSNPDIAAFERYLNRYPRGSRRNEVLLLIGRRYEAKAGVFGGDTLARRKAIESYRAIIRDDPDGDCAPQARLGCGRQYCELDKQDSALVFLREFSLHCPDSSMVAEACYFEGCSEKSRQNYSVALEKFKKVLYSYPFSGFARQARFGIAEIFFAMGRYHDALTNYRLLAQHSVPDERAAWARFGIGRCCIRLGKTGEALQILSAIVSEKPLPECAGSARFELAGLARKSNNAAEAMRQYTLILGIPSYPDKRTVLMNMGSLSIDTREYSGAVSQFDRALAFSKTDVDSAVAEAGVITALVMDGSRRDADRKIAQFTSRFGQDREIFAQVVFHEGLRHLVTKDYVKARSRFAVVIDKYSKSPYAAAAAYQTALSYFYEGKKEKALDLFNRFVGEYPQSDFVGLAQFKIGMIYYEQNDFEQAVTFFSAALSHAETDSTTRFRAAYNAAIGLQKLSRWLDAGRMYELILDSFPDEISPSAAQLKIGFCLMQASHTVEALAHFQKAGDNPAAQEKPEVLYWIATCYAKMGDYRRATVEYLKVPALYAGMGRWDLTSECEAARLFERMGDYGKAVSLYKKILLTDGETGDLGKEALTRMEHLNGIMENQ